jgi:hypothetical protein
MIKFREDIRINYRTRTGGCVRSFGLVVVVLSATAAGPWEGSRSCIMAWLFDIPESEMRSVIILKQNTALEFSY